MERPTSLALGWRVLRPLAVVLKVALAAAAVGAVVYWLKFTPVTVNEHPLRRGTVVAEVMGTGTLEARVKSTVGPKIAGRITEVLVDQNDRVAAGKPLVRLDDAELRQQVQIAEANLATAEAALLRLKADRDRAKAVVTQAQQEHARTARLQPVQAVSMAEADRATEALGIATAGVARAGAAIAEGEKQLAAARETLEYHRARLADTVIAAPFDGLIVRRLRDPGDVVVPGSPALSIISTEELWIAAWVDETEMARLAEGQAARVVFRSEPDREYPGEVARLGREADRETREFVVEVRVLELPRNWAVGQRAEVHIETARLDSALLLPAETLAWRDGEPGVLVNDAGRAAWRGVALGPRGRDVVAVAAGLADDDVVVTPADPAAPLAVGRRIAAP